MEKNKQDEIYIGDLVYLIKDNYPFKLEERRDSRDVEKLWNEIYASDSPKKKGDGVVNQDEEDGERKLSIGLETDQSVGDKSEGVPCV